MKFIQASVAFFWGNALCDILFKRKSLTNLENEIKSFTQLGYRAAVQNVTTKLP